MAEPFEYPLPNMLTVYADGILSISQTHEVVKLYLAKNDNPINAEGDPRPATVGQLILPMSGFINSFAFLEASINKYVRTGLVSGEQLELAREAYAKLFEQPK